VRFHKHDEERIAIHMLVEHQKPLIPRSARSITRV
jgi:hypothetical protein